MNPKDSKLKELHIPESICLSFQGLDFIVGFSAKFVGSF